MEETQLWGKKARSAFNFFNLSESQRFCLETYGNLIRLKHEPTYCHSVRVALLGVRFSKFSMLDPRMLLCAGLLHDVGKTVVDKDLLLKKDFTAADRQRMEEHSLYGYYLLKGVHDFFAEVALRHHRYVADGYPRVLPSYRVLFSKKSEELINQYARIVALIDFYDAASTRESGHPGVRRFNTKEEVEALLVEHFPSLAEAELILRCYENGIFGIDIEKLEVKELWQA